MVDNALEIFWSSNSLIEEEAEILEMKWSALQWQSSGLLTLSPAVLCYFSSFVSS